MIRANTPAPAKVIFTYEDYRNTPDDGKRYEIIDGDLCVSLPPPVNHQVMAEIFDFKFLSLPIRKKFNRPVGSTGYARWGYSNSVASPPRNK